MLLLGSGRETRGEGRERGRSFPRRRGWARLLGFLRCCTLSVDLCSSILEPDLDFTVRHAHRLSNLLPSIKRRRIGNLEQGAELLELLWHDALALGFRGDGGIGRRHGINEEQRLLGGSVGMVGVGVLAARRRRSGWPGAGRR
ncbi:hypothetical protein BCR35DRAFT_306178, partial [Leucosporidium creatinivorum]